MVVSSTDDEIREQEEDYLAFMFARSFNEAAGGLTDTSLDEATQLDSEDHDTAATPAEQFADAINRLVECQA